MTRKQDPSQKVVKDVKKVFSSRDIPLVGAADARELDRTAPEGFRPSDLLPGAKTVLVTARPLPRAVFETGPQYKNALYVNAFSSYYHLMDEAASAACLTNCPHYPKKKRGFLGGIVGGYPLTTPPPSTRSPW
ncbi:MAG: hypothetical protein JRI97_10945 [Deltaproteobacteria bacterium]|nr:hypothetical protein [Deltaproteobacteria bacterium]